MHVNSRNVRLRGLQVHWVEAGEGPPLLLVHGFLVSHKEWLPMLPRLSQHFRCIVPDLPGFGASEKRAPGAFPYTREAFAETLLDLLKELGHERVHLCAHSYGGGIALMLAATFPARVERLTLIDSACYPFPVPVKARLPLLPLFGPLVFKRLYRRAIFRDYFRHDVFSGHSGIDLRRVDSYYDDFNTLQARAAAYAVFRETIDVGTLPRLIPDVRAPTLVVWGDDDRVFPLGLAHRLVRELPKATLKVVPNSGHAPNEEHPDATADLVIAHHLGDTRESK